VRKKAIPRKHSTSSYNNNLKPSKIKLLIDRPTELAEALDLAETIAAVHVRLAAASDRLNYLLQSKNQKAVDLHSTSQDKSPEHVEVCGNEAKMATPRWSAAL
jgi:chemotaxis regulatin CheY-phosphate phosphatase CheZ